MELRKTYCSNGSSSKQKLEAFLLNYGNVSQVLFMTVV